MTYLNQFHEEAMERKLHKIEESTKSPMSSEDAANYMKRNFEMAKQMEAALKKGKDGDVYVVDAEIKRR